ncbi:hypothetical protein [Kitasatospora cheerisanensis]|uniref:DUF4240 domain-containing protein n=1 Tax=Kitasatospora cheerisanensis KCTC 2395 TaxID=1348663 RepID=A0A066YLI3_9ACTN|nr:hypothetical protein [Kitasatospora cheerisanensis]KDN80764.1 hypothetical protein KCH_75440 [Kitasatospora cheerisanensis KCTC 2395]
MGPEHIPEWFWQAMEAARPRLAALESWLGAQPRQVVEDFALAHEAAQDALADPAEGVRVDGETWSEDSTEDLCRWVVGQGREFWQAVVAGELTPEAAARRYLDGADPWDEEVADPRHRGYQSTGFLAHGVYRSRFGEDLDERLDRRR